MSPQDPGYWVKIHHLEYTDGGILDPDDVLADVVEDKDKVDDSENVLHFPSPGSIISSHWCSSQTHVSVISKRYHLFRFHLDSS